VTHRYQRLSAAAVDEIWIGLREGHAAKPISPWASRRPSGSPSLPLSGRGWPPPARTRSLVPLAGPKPSRCMPKNFLTYRHCFR
jgi:hypothetical protein